jgi:hypothetical protein
MVMPPLLNLANEAAYRAHYERTCCRAAIVTHDGIRVYFSKDRFGHAFFESTDRRGNKDLFSIARAERMDWIAAALADPAAICYQGWNSKSRCSGFRHCHCAGTEAGRHNQSDLCHLFSSQ